jgi:hypothetical protein
LEDGFGCVGYDLAVLSMAIEDSEDFAFVRDLVLEYHILVLHIVIVPEAHFAEAYGSDGININGLAFGLILRTL